MDPRCLDYEVYGPQRGGANLRFRTLRGWRSRTDRLLYSSWYPQQNAKVTSRFMGLSKWANEGDSIGHYAAYGDSKCILSKPP